MKLTQINHIAFLQMQYQPSFHGKYGIIGNSYDVEMVTNRLKSEKPKDLDLLDVSWVKPQDEPALIATAKEARQFMKLFNKFAEAHGMPEWLAIPENINAYAERVTSVFKGVPMIEAGDVLDAIMRGDFDFETGKIFKTIDISPHQPLKALESQHSES